MSSSTQLRLEQRAGGELLACARDMVRIAQLLRVEVVLRFDGIELRADELMSESDVCDDFYAEKENESRSVRETRRKDKNEDQESHER